MNKIAAVYPTAIGKFIGKMLWPNSVGAVYYFRAMTDPDMLAMAMSETFKPTLEIVSTQRFDAELDFINLFGSRAPDGHLEGIIAPSEDELFNHFEHQFFDDIEIAPLPLDENFEPLEPKR